MVDHILVVMQLVGVSRTLQSVADLYSRVFIIIDALDECQASHGCRARLLTEIFALLIKTLVLELRCPEVSILFKPIENLAR